MLAAQRGTGQADERGASMKSRNAAPERDHAAICQAVRDIPHGCVASYGEVAARAGLPGRARLVGRVLAMAGSGEALP
ncbi:MAG: MGMT family protein, partial [Xanthomonadales bacterium]|nr:MGMT family protein [Xanthomonadales bacterium]